MLLGVLHMSPPHCDSCSFTGSVASVCPGTELNLRDTVLGEVENTSFIALPGKGWTQWANDLKTVCSSLKVVVRRCIATAQRGGCDCSWTFFWFAGGEVSGSQHHQPSGFYCSGVSASGQRSINSFYLVGVSGSANQLKGAVLCIPWGEIRILPQSCTIVFWPIPACLSIPLPSLISNSVNLPFGTQGSHRLNEAYCLPKRNSGDRKTFVPRSPRMSCLVLVGLGTNPELRERALQLSLAFGFMLKSAEARSGAQTVNTFL